jgi:hypothetical protein
VIIFADKNKHSLCFTQEYFLLSIFSEYFENIERLFFFAISTGRNKMNTIAYLIYLIITYLITVQVGLSFYRNGWVYLKDLLSEDETLAGTVNRILLTGYYLLNLGYAAIMIRFWEKVETWTALLSSICAMTGKIMLTLAVIHFINMAVIFWFSRRKI